MSATLTRPVVKPGVPPHAVAPNGSRSNAPNSSAPKPNLPNPGATDSARRRVPDVGPAPRAGGIGKRPTPASNRSNPSPAVRSAATPASRAPVGAPKAQANIPRPFSVSPNTKSPAADAEQRPDHTILFQSFFKSVGPRTYVAQLKRATNDNHYLVLTEGRRDKESGEVRKHRINIFSEDFDAFFNLLRDAARFIKDHPLPPEFMAKRKEFWSKTKRPRNCRRRAS